MSQINRHAPGGRVMLVLVVILILTAPLLARGAAAGLAQSARHQHAAGSAPQVRISIDRTGQVFLDEQAHSLDSLAQALAERARAQPGAEVQLRADQAVSYGSVVQVMGLAQQLGYSRIAFVAQVQAPLKPQLIAANPAGNPHAHGLKTTPTPMPVLSRPH